MAKRTVCAVEGCSKPNAGSRRNCYAHWREQRRLVGPWCIEAGCSAPAESKKLCGLHYQRFLHGPPTKHRNRPFNLCSLPNCDRPYYARGYCNTHWAAWRRNGDPLVRHVAVRGTGSINSNGYRAIGKKLEHRMVMEGVLRRPLLPEETVHHKNGHKSDNRPENLELWSRQQPPGQRVKDLLAWAEEIVARYGPERDLL